LNVLEKTKKPAYQSKVDFGNEIGCKKSSAQITNFMSEIPVCRDDRICKHFPPGVVKTQARKASSQIELLANGASGDTGLFYEIP